MKLQVKVCVVIIVDRVRDVNEITYKNTFSNSITLGVHIEQTYRKKSFL